MAVITQAVLDALRTTLDLKFQNGYDEAKNWYDRVSTTIPSNNASNTYGWIAQNLTLEEWLGPRTAQNLSEHSYVLNNRKFQRVVQIPREKIADDSLGIYTAVTMPNLGKAAKRHPDVLAAQALQNNGNGFDGVAFFSTSHPTYDEAGDTYSNDNPNTDLTGDGFLTVSAAMQSILGENGLPLELSPKLLLVPPQLEYKAKTVMHSETYAMPVTGTTTAATVQNVWKGTCEVLVVPQLSNQPKVWYAIDTDHGIMPLVYQLREAAELVARVNLEDPTVFDLDVFTWGVRIRDAMGYTLPFLIQRATTP